MTPVALDRLRDGRDIAAVLRARRQRAGRLLVVHARRREDHAPARVAVVASRRVGGAVQRNRAKRVLREAIRMLPWSPGLDVVVIARGGASRCHRDDALGELEGLGRELDLLSAVPVVPGRAAG